MSILIFRLIVVEKKKDSKLVEQRRKMLQDYLRQVVNIVYSVDKDLNTKPCRETLVKAIPFLW